jgi:serine/threonine-protein kinase
MREAVAAKERLLGSNHPDLAISLSSFGSLATTREALDDALAFTERAVHILAEHGDPAGAHMARALTNRGEVLFKLKRFSEAVAVFTEARDLLLASAEPEPGVLFEPLAGLGAAQFAAGLVDDAVLSLERALELAQEAAVPRHFLADTQFCLARALWETRRDPTRAVSLAQSASLAFRSHHHQRMLRQTDEWLAHHEVATKRAAGRL